MNPHNIAGGAGAVMTANASASGQTSAMATPVPAAGGAGNLMDVAELRAIAAAEEPADWLYEMRRDMQEVVPRVWLGPYSCARDRSRLEAAGITHVLCIRDAGERHIVRTPFEGALAYLVIEVSDSHLQNLIPYFAQATAFINASLASGGTVLVHCNGGISRSPSFMVAYLMETYNLESFVAFQVVQNKRFCINPLDAFKYQLKEYEPLIKVRKLTGTSGFSAHAAQQSHGVRRRYEEDEDSATHVREWDKAAGEIRFNSSQH